MGSCARALWTRPKPTTSVTQASASITQVRKAVVGKQRKIVHDMRPKDVPVISRSEPAEGSWWQPVYLNKRFRSASTEPPAVLDEFAIGTRDGDAGAGKGW